jgi:hypothetical protein
VWSISIRAGSAPRGLLAFHGPGKVLEHRAAEPAGEDLLERLTLRPVAALVDEHRERPWRAFLIVAVARGDHDPSPARSIPSASPASIDQERAPSQIPCVERPPGRPSIRRHGHGASQLQDSRYVPWTR